MTPRSRILAYGFCGLLIVLGIVAGVVVNGLVGQLVEYILISLGFVFALGLVFYEVGLSEDRERAREEARRQRQARPSKPRPRPRLERMRGRARRLR